MKTPLAEEIFTIRNLGEFESRALEVFKFQANNNAIYKDFIRHLGIESSQINSVDTIPFLPIEFFKTHRVVSASAEADITFSSSGTTGSPYSKHPVIDRSIYEDSFRRGFEYFYGNITDYTLLALLPSYTEQESSSLIYMVDDLIKQAKPGSAFYLYDHEDLAKKLEELKNKNQKCLLIGVSYALLDFTENYQINFPEIIVMETGGMKGRRKEMIREELHKALQGSFNVPQIHSEYGMTELLSQAYSKGNGLFECPPWMQIRIRDTNDPLQLLPEGNTGGINIIDLANLYSCSFIATQDLGRLYEDGKFEVIGRFDQSDVRGCNLMIQ